MIKCLQIRYAALLALLLGSFSSVRAQDPYFSQYTQISSIYNPAMTGMHDGILKASLLYQDHLNFSNSSIRKGVLSFEYGKDIEVGNFVVDRLGVGLGIIYDDFNVGAFFNNSVYLSFAYLKSLNKDNNHKLGLGLQFHYSNRTIDYSRLTFGSQFLEGYYDETISSEEILGTRTSDYFDVQAGLMYSFTSDYFNLKAGISGYHLTQPESRSINNFKVKISLNSFFSFETWFKNYKRLYIDGYYRHKNLNLSYFGVLFRYTAVNFGEFNKHMDKTYLLVGCNINSNLLFSPYLGWRSPSFEAGLTFDIKVSDIDYFAYPFESFLEFMIAYKLMPKSQAEQNIGIPLFENQ